MAFASVSVKRWDAVAYCAMVSINVYDAKAKLVA